MDTLRRLAAAIIVALLVVCASNVSAVTLADPCTASQPTSTDQAVCPDTCGGCGWCEIAEPVVPMVSCAPGSVLSTSDASLSRIPRLHPRDILHVPKSHLA
jgi:hypothetical protein